MVRRFLFLALVAALLEGCSGGGCSRSDDSRVDDLPPAGMPQNPDAILSQPVQFEAQSVEEAFRLVTSRHELTSVELAQVIVVTEAALNHLTQDLEQLKRNDDPADTWHVIRELRRAPWLDQAFAIVDALGERSLDPVESARYESLCNAATYARALLAELEPNS